MITQRHVSQGERLQQIVILLVSVGHQIYKGLIHKPGARNGGFDCYRTSSLTNRSEQEASYKKLFNINTTSDDICESLLSIPHFLDSCIADPNKFEKITFSEDVQGTGGRKTRTNRS